MKKIRDDMGIYSPYPQDYNKGTGYESQHFLWKGGKFYAELQNYPPDCRNRHLVGTQASPYGCGGDLPRDSNGKSIPNQCGCTGGNAGQYEPEESGGKRAVSKRKESRLTVEMAGGRSR